MMKLGIIVTDTTRETGSLVTADPLEPGHPGGTKVRRGGEHRS